MDCCSILQGRLVDGGILNLQTDYPHVHVGAGEPHVHIEQCLAAQGCIVDRVVSNIDEMLLDAAQALADIPSVRIRLRCCMLVFVGELYRLLINFYYRTLSPRVLLEGGILDQKSVYVLVYARLFRVGQVVYFNNLHGRKI